MWSNISAPKSALKAAKVGQQQVKLENDEPIEQQENNQEILTANFSDQDQKLVASGSPLMRYKHAVCSSPNSGFIYIHGGRFANGVPLDDDLWRFDAHENCWLQLKTAGCKPPSLQEHTLSEYKGHLYMFGGQVSAASGQEHFFWRLDLAKRHWVSLNMNAANCSSLKYGARQGPTNRRGHSACIYRDSIYIFGGYEDFRGSTNQLWQYDLLNERWELRNLSSSSACHPEPRHNHSAIIYQDDMYIYGGLSNLKPLGDLWRWSWRAKRWFREKTRGQSPGQLHGHSAIQAFGSMFVFGGERQSGRTTRSLWRLNLSNLSWKKIKPRGPRPNATTWHAAIANPLSVFDQANYLIEGEMSDLEQEQAQQSDQLALVLDQQQSMSDTQYNPTPMQQTIPMESIRPVTMTNASDRSGQQTNSPLGSINHHQQHSQKIVSRLKVSKSSSDQMSLLAKQTAGQSRDRVTKTKRRLRLSFLRRTKKQSGETRPLPTSFSAASILTSATQNGNQLPLPVQEVAKGDFVGNLEVKQEEDVEMLNEDEQNGVPDTNLAILDNLDTDIKQMFHRADLSLDQPDGDQSRLGLGVATSRATLARDSMTQSQLSASLAPTITQSYKTAREHLSSQSTMTITAPALESQAKAFSELASEQVATTPCNKLADVRQRKSMHLMNASQLRRNSGHNHDQDHSRQQARGRPKSEIVQSLIDRADARIKNACMPLFNPDSSSTGHQSQEQQHRHRFASNDLSILGELANHPMFERTDGGQRRQLLDKSKRHTIHQTMTYYNLYFAEERQGGDSSSSPPSAESAARQKTASGGGKQGAKGPMGQANDGNDKSLTSNNTNSLSAALVGVRDGGSSSGGDLSQRTTTLGRLESEVGSLMQSSDSRTLCNDQQGEQHQPASGQRFESAAAPATRQNGFGSSVTDKFAGGEFDDATDNTSLSFSVIAEFEEDDMLQYSSPTTSNRMVTNDRDDLEQDQDEGDDSEEDDARALDDLNQQNSIGIQQHANEFGEVKSGAMMPQKSTSSGYDSIRSNQWSSQCNGQQPNQHQQPQQHQSASYSASSYGGDSPSRTSNCSPNHLFHQCQAQAAKRTTTLPVKQLRELEAGQASVAMSTTTASSTTAESLALTTTNDTSDCCPMTPPSKSLPSSPPDLGSNRQSQQHCQLQQRNNSSFASSLISGPSRLFGKRRAKTRFWQLCMFVIGGKQQGGQHNTGNLNEPITIWRLYI